MRLIKRCAHADYLRSRRIVGGQRDSIVMRVRQSRDPLRAVLDVHEAYVIAVCSVFGVEHLLELLGDPVGIWLLTQYREKFVDHYESTCKQLGAQRRPADDNDLAMLLQPEAASLKELLTSQTL